MASLVGCTLRTGLGDPPWARYWQKALASARCWLEGLAPASGTASGLVRQSVRAPGQPCCARCCVDQRLHEPWSRPRSSRIYTLQLYSLYRGIVLCCAACSPYGNAGTAE